MKAQYHNTLTNETYILSSENGMDMEQCWKRFDWVCKRNGWNNEDVFYIKVSLV